MIRGSVLYWENKCLDELAVGGFNALIVYILNEWYARTGKHDLWPLGEICHEYVKSLYMYHVCIVSSMKIYGESFECKDMLHWEEWNPYCFYLNVFFNLLLSIVSLE